MLAGWLAQPEVAAWWRVPDHQIRLIRAIKAGRADEARFIMRDHMIEAEKYMLEMADIRKRGRLQNAAPAQPGDS